MDPATTGNNAVPDTSHNDRTLAEDSSKTVLFFFSLGFDVPTPSLHLMEAMVEDSMLTGWSVHIVASHTAGVYPDIPEKLRSNPRLHWDIVKQTEVAKSAFAKRYLLGVKYALDCFARIRRLTDYDIIYVQSSPTALYNLLVAKFCARRKPVIYSVQDMFPGSSIQSGVMTRAWMQRMFYRLQKMAYGTANHITVISEDMKQRVIEQGVPPEKISIIVNWYDDNTVHEVPWQENRFVRRYKLAEDKFYVQYAGTMGYVFDYTMVLDVAELLKDYPDIEFQMIGNGSKRDAFARESERRELGNIVFIPLQPPDLVADVYSASSICLIPLKRGIIGNSVPSKAALIMACNRAIVNSVDEDSEYYRMFPENRIGVSAPNNDPQAVANAILGLYHHRDEREELARNGMLFAKREYSRSVNTDRLLELFRSTCARS